MTSFIDRLKKSYRILVGDDEEEPTEITDLQNKTHRHSVQQGGIPYTTTTQDVLTPILGRIAVDAASVPIRHAIFDTNERFVNYRPGALDDRLNLKANIDQTGTAFRQDLYQTMLNEGYMAVVPTEVSGNPSRGSYADILSVRCGIIQQWFHDSVLIELYNDLTGQRREIILPKSYVAICYNPFYSMMNEPNGTVKRLRRKLALLDAEDDRNASPNLDLILKMSYAVRGEIKKEKALERLAALEEQLYNSQYGIGYVDATEDITQLNRPVLNNLPTRIETLTKDLHNQLGLTASVFDGTATPEEMAVYFNRTIEPLISAVIEPMVATFLTPKARTQGHRIIPVPILFKMAPILTVAEAVDKFTRNAILTSNEVRGELRLPPSSDPDASRLRNKNLNDTSTQEGDTPKNDEEKQQ